MIWNDRSIESMTENVKVLYIVKESETVLQFMIDKKVCYRIRFKGQRFKFVRKVQWLDKWFLNWYCALGISRDIFAA